MVSIRARRGSEPPPDHVAIIMDGNGRWALARGLPRIAGHERGAEAVRRTVRACRDLGIRYLTLYAFSSENWKRPPSEVDDLMGLLRAYLRHEIAALHDQDVRVRFIGGRGRLASDIAALIEDAEGMTAANRGLVLIVALNYGSRDEIVRAARRLAQETLVGSIQPDAIDESLLASRLETSNVPDPDLVIRTAGEKRLSNFLLWQAAYSELVFFDVCWPDFTKTDIEEAIREFHRRERRYGATYA